MKSLQSSNATNNVNKNNIFLFESSWEVCNKVGGIYAVVSSKAKQMVKKYKDNYLLLGPYFKSKADAEFSVLKAPVFVQKVIDKFKRDHNVDLYYGVWHIKGKPKVLLVDFKNKLSEKDAIKTELWNFFKVDSLFSKFDFEEPVVWSYIVGMIVDEFYNVFKKDSDSSFNFKDFNVILHSHEWLSGSSILFLKKYNSNVKTVFTTHATVLGRTISGAWGNLYDIIGNINPDDTAIKLGVIDKHSLEKATALHSTIFTTVSDITGFEAEKILGRKPDVIVPNGLDFSSFPDNEVVSIKHRIYREKIREFLIPYFFPYYTFDLEHTLLVYISGRYEFSNKGIDVFIKSLGLLNEELKRKNDKRTIVVFFFIPSNIISIRYDLLESKSLFEDVQDEIKDYSDRIEKNIIYGFAERKTPDQLSLFDEEFIFKLKKMLLNFKKEGLPPLSTHHIVDENEDIIINSFKENGLLNRKEDKVKVVFYPGYLSSSDGLLNLDYYPAVMGCHLGVFPSYYEPWGYTPMESAGYAVPSITTDFSGLGAYMLKNNIGEKGIWILKRKNKNFFEISEELKNIIKKYSDLSHDERIEKKHEAFHTSRVFDWKFLIEKYFEAHFKALEK